MRLSLLVALVASLTACTINLKSELEFKSDNEPPARDRTTAGGEDSTSGDVVSGRQTDDARSLSTVDAGDGGATTLYVVNLADEAICWVYADPCDDTSDDLLGDEVLPDGWYLTVGGLAEGCYDLWAFPCTDDGLWYSRVPDVGADFTWILVPQVSFGDTADSDGDTSDTGVPDASGHTGHTDDSAL